LPTVVEDSGDVVYHNSWAGNFTVNRENVSQLVTDGLQVCLKKKKKHGRRMVK